VLGNLNTFYNAAYTAPGTVFKNMRADSDAVTCSTQRLHVIIRLNFPKLSFLVLRIWEVVISELKDQENTTQANRMDAVLTTENW